ncbi:MAG: flagellar hook-length control protein FliK [Nitrospiraceae bacterium]|nr:MAG: flagellar hook-length control protein FliK [Nitrospiraceae bacterium]
MIKHVGADGIRNILTPAGAPDKSLTLKVGAIVKAEVINTSEGGNVLLRIITAGTSDQAQKGILIKAFTEVPLSKGQQVYLEVLGGKDSIKMQFIGNMKDPSMPLPQNIPAKFLDMLAKLSEARLGNAEFKNILTMLKSLPESVKTAIPEFRGLEKLMVNVRELDGNVLRAFIETSGVAFETKLKIAALSDPQSLLRNLAALQTEGDLKGLLLRIGNLLKDRQAVKVLEQAGFKISEVSSLIEKFTRHIEFFQLTSRINDMFCTFMPVLWDDLRDGEFQFKKGKRGGSDSYTCDLNLDLEKLGKLSVSVTVMEKAFYVSLFAERPEIADFIASEKNLLEERFATQGLLLKALTVKQRSGIAIGMPQRQGVNLKI